MWLCLSFCLSFCLFSFFLSFCLSVCLSVCLSAFLSFFLSFCLSLSVCMSVCLSVQACPFPKKARILVWCFPGVLFAEPRHTGWFLLVGVTIIGSTEISNDAATTLDASTTLGPLSPLRMLKTPSLMATMEMLHQWKYPMGLSIVRTSILS